MIDLPVNIDETLFHAVEIERCRRDPLYFIQEYVKIEDRDVEGIVIPFQLWNAQKEALESFLSERLIQIMKANQLGLTWLIIAYAVWRMRFNAGYSVKAISDTETKAAEIIRRVDFILRHLPNWLISEDKTADVWYESTSLTVTVHHKGKEDATIQAFTSSPKVAASFTANLFLFDEWALQEYAAEIWTYAFPTINRPTGGQVIGISTIERGTLFEDIWRNNKAFKKIFLGWYSDPRRDKAWYDNTVQQLGRDETLKHYPATPEEALAIPGGAFFDNFNSLVHIRNKAIIESWYRKYRCLDYGLDMLACYFIYVDGYGRARIYKEIHKPNLVISEAAYEILKESGAKVPEDVNKWNGLSKEEKQKIADTSTEKFLVTYAPIDMFARAKDTGKSLDMTWQENCITLSKVDNKLEAGCAKMKQWLNPYVTKDVQTSEEYTTANLTIDRDAAPKLVESLLNIQKDKRNPNIWSNEPHVLTHSVTAIMYFCTEYAIPAVEDKPNPLKWLEDLIKEKNKKKLKTTSMSR